MNNSQEVAITIKALAKSKKITIGKMLADCELSVNTLSSMQSGGYYPRLEAIARIADYLDCSVDYLLGREEAPTKDADSFPAKNNSPLSDEALHIAQRYNQLDKIGMGAVQAIMDYEEMRIGSKEPYAIPQQRKTKIIPLIGNSFAAGPAEPDFGNMWEDYEVEANNPAQFAIRINGNSMEPYLPDGSIAFGKKETPRDGDVAAFLLDGEFLCKQICQDMSGNVYLFSLNRARSDADVTIWHNSERTLNCFGTIIMKKRVSLPKD